MTFKEYLEKNKKAIQNMHVENIDELKKLVDKEKIGYSDEELKQAWSYIKNQNVSEDGALDENALNAVAGGVGDIDVDTKIDTDVGKEQLIEKTTVKIEDDHTDTSILKKSIHTAGSIQTGGALSF